MFGSAGRKIHGNGIALSPAPDADMTELDEFIELLAEACQRDASDFNYGSLVVNGTWKAG